MKIGILADIHERVDPLRSALKTFRDNRVEQVVLLGDVFETANEFTTQLSCFAMSTLLVVFGEITTSV